MRKFFKLKNFNKFNKLKIRGGFTLIEILISLIITGFLSVILLDFSRWIVISSRRAAALLLARDRGERVIAFIEPRILNCALGLHECRDKDLFQYAIGKGTSKELSILTQASYFPIVVYRDVMMHLAREGSDGVFRGTGFYVIYSSPSELAVKISGDTNLLTPGESLIFTPFRSSKESKFVSDRQYNNLESWCLFPSVGVPLHIDSLKDDNFKLTLAASWENSVSLPPIAELYYLKADRFFVIAIDEEFRYQNLEKSWQPTSGYPRESGVLAIWVEWNPDKKIFDLYVLASGGEALSGKTSRPADWPDNAEWRPEFANHELYVSRASWRIENL